MKQVPFWVDDFPRPHGLTSDLPSETDYLVVGSGLTGLSAALRLSEAGRTVTVIDAGPIAGGASSMNTGMVSADVAAGIDNVHAMLGPKVAGEIWTSTMRALDTVRSINDRPGVDALIHHGGTATLGRGSKHLKAFDRQVAWYRRRLAVEWEVVDARDIDRIVGGDHFNVALWRPEGFGLDPARLAFGLAREADRAGAILVDECTAGRIDRTAPGLTLQTTRGRIRAGEVILATNGYTTRMPSRELARLVVPVGSYAISTEPLAERAEEILPGGAMTHTRKRLFNHMRRTPDDRILIGGRRNLRTDLDLEESAADLRRTLVEFWPQLADVEVTHVWGGKLGVSFDRIPHIGKIDGAWYASGYSGHGVGLSVQLGVELAGMLLDEDPPSIFSQIPHNGRIYYSGRSPWFLTPASITSRTLDRMGL